MVLAKFSEICYSFVIVRSMAMTAALAAVPIDSGNPFHVLSTGCSVIRKKGNNP